mmetsp:Transcript_13387/g.30826  ORF Transcript_13387/g.30826 Transcript_13387/m.30826 type:complete len:236 (+) Transcript_13387:1771-2478(+)
MLCFLNFFSPRINLNCIDKHCSAAYNVSLTSDWMAHSIFDMLGSFTPGSFSRKYTRSLLSSSMCLLCTRSSANKEPYSCFSIIIPSFDFKDLRAEIRDSTSLRRASVQSSLQELINELYLSMRGLLAEKVFMSLTLVSKNFTKSVSDLSIGCLSRPDKGSPSIAVSSCRFSAPLGEGWCARVQSVVLSKPMDIRSDVETTLMSPSAMLATGDPGKLCSSSGKTVPLAVEAWMGGR